MCLTINGSLRDCIKTAKEDITFYKATRFISGKLETSYQGFIIEPGKEYAIGGKLEGVDVKDDKVNAGVFHLYKTFEDARREITSFVLKTVVRKGERYIDGTFNDVPSVGVKRVCYEFVTPENEVLYKSLIKGEIDVIFGISEDFVYVHKTGFGDNFLCKDGKILSDEWFDDVWNFFEGYAVVQKEGKGYNFLSKDGKILSNEWFDIAEDFFKGSAIVKLDGKLGKIDTKGNVTWEE